jgi:hypothetical protein
VGAEGSEVVCGLQEAPFDLAALGPHPNPPPAEPGEETRRRHRQSRLNQKAIGFSVSPSSPMSRQWKRVTKLGSFA